MSAPLPEIHPQTWRFMPGIYLSWYSQHPESSLADWLSDMRRAHSAVFMDSRATGCLVSRLRFSNTPSLPAVVSSRVRSLHCLNVGHERLRFSSRVNPNHPVIERLQISKVRRDIGECRTEKGPDDAGPSNQGGNPRYRLDDVSLVTDLLPLNLGFIVGRFLSVSETILAAEWRITMCETPHSAYL
jgi:hypothetical protein